MCCVSACHFCHIAGDVESPEEVVALKHEAEETTVRVVTLEEKLGKKDEEIVALKHEAKETNVRVVTLEDKLRKKDEEIVALKHEAKETNVRVVSLEDKLRKKDEEIVALKHEAKETNVRLGKNEDEMVALRHNKLVDVNALMQMIGELQQKLDAIQSQTYHKSDIGMKCL